MKKNDGGWVRFICFPLEEAGVVIGAMEQAAEKNDVEAFKWCGRRMAWLWDVSEEESGDDCFFPEHQFNREWEKDLKADPPPESIAALFVPEEEEEEQVPEYEEITCLKFDPNNPPGITSRKSAICLLDKLIIAEETHYHTVALEAIKNALEKGEI